MPLLLNTESASVGQVLTTRQVQDLTVSGSNPTWLALIAPGVQATTSQTASTGDGGGLIWAGLTQDFGNFGRIGATSSAWTARRMRATGRRGNEPGARLPWVK